MEEDNLGELRLPVRVLERGEPFPGDPARKSLSWIAGLSLRAVGEGRGMVLKPLLGRGDFVRAAAFGSVGEGIGGVAYEASLVGKDVDGFMLAEAALRCPFGEVEIGCEFESSFCVGDFASFGRLERIVGEGVAMVRGAEGRVGVTGISKGSSGGSWRVRLERSWSSGSLVVRQSAGRGRGVQTRDALEEILERVFDRKQRGFSLRAPLREQIRSLPVPCGAHAQLPAARSLEPREFAPAESHLHLFFRFRLKCRRFRSCASSENARGKPSTRWVRSPPRSYPRSPLSAQLFKKRNPTPNDPATTLLRPATAVQPPRAIPASPAHSLEQEYSDSPKLSPSIPSTPTPRLVSSE